MANVALAIHMNGKSGKSVDVVVAFLVTTVKVTERNFVRGHARPK